MGFSHGSATAGTLIGALSAWLLASAGQQPEELWPYLLFGAIFVILLAHLIQLVLGAELRIAGRGAFERQLREMARGMPHVRFLGSQDRGDLRELYRTAEAVIVPSLCYETFGLVALEALAVGTPVVVRDRGALPEIVEATGGGLVFGEPEGLPAALTRLLDRPELSRELGERGRRAVERSFSESRILDEYLALVHRLLPGAGRSLNTDRALPRLSG